MHHSFDINFAAQFSVEESILIHHFQHWVRINKQLKRNNIDGRTWTYSTQEEIAANFPYWSTKQIERILNKLTKKGVLLKDNFNKCKYDRTTWYAFKDEELFFGSSISRNREMVKTESGDGPPEIGRPIPDSKTYTKTNEEHPPNPPEGGSARVACGAFVKLTQKEKEALEEVYGAPRVEGIIEEINDYLASTGKKPYRDYAAAIRQWARRRGMVKVEKPKDEILEGFQEKKIEKRVVTKEELDEEWFNKLESVNNLTGSSRYQAFNIRSYLQSELRLHSDVRGINFTDLPEAKFYYGEKGFRDKVYSTLRKLDIMVAS